jgi:hypothetical protein
MRIMVDEKVDDKPSREEKDYKQEHHDLIKEGSHGKVIQGLCLLK